MSRPSTLVLDTASGGTTLQYASQPPTAAASTSGEAYGVPAGGAYRSTLLTTKATVRSGTAITSIGVGLAGSHNGASGSWVPLLCYRASDTARAAAQTQTIAVGSGGGTYDAIMTEDTRDWPFVAVAYITSGGAMAAGDRLLVWQEGGR